MNEFGFVHINQFLRRFFFSSFLFEKAKSIVCITYFFINTTSNTLWMDIMLDIDRSIKEYRDTIT